jgi:hypothetical protein
MQAMARLVMNSNALVLSSVLRLGFATESRWDSSTTCSPHHCFAFRPVTR